MTVYNEDISSIFLRKDVQCVMYRKHHDKSRVVKQTDKERKGERERARERERERARERARERTREREKERGGRNISISLPGV